MELSRGAWWATPPARVGLDQRVEQARDPLGQFVGVVFPDLERDAQPEPLDEIEVNRRARIGRLEFGDGRVEAGDDPELSQQPGSLVVADLDEVPCNFDPNRIRSACSHDDQA